jgi:hypothetical protein
MASTISKVSRSLLNLTRLLVIPVATTGLTSDTPVSRGDCERANCPSDSREVLTPVTTIPNPHGA